MQPPMKGAPMSAQTNNGRRAAAQAETDAAAQAAASQAQAQADAVAAEAARVAQAEADAEAARIAAQVAEHTDAPRSSRRQAAEQAQAQVRKAAVPLVLAQGCEWRPVPGGKVGVTVEQTGAVVREYL